MSYSTLQVGVTGPAGRIGSGTEYHIDTKFSDALSWNEIRDRFDVLAARYQQDNRSVEFSNQGVGGLVYDVNASPEERIRLLQRAAAAHNHSDNPGFYSFDYYAPTTGNDRFHSSAEGAPIYVVGLDGRKGEGGQGGGYGNYGYVLDENGNVVSKTGHGDTEGYYFRGGTFGGDGASSGQPLSSEVPDAPDPVTDPDPDPQPVQTAKERVARYKDMSASALNAEYDQLRAEDPAKAREYGMEMHKAHFGKL